MLIWQAVSTALALFSAIALLANGSNAGNAKKLVYIVSSFCFVIAAIQVDNFFVGLRMRQTFKRSRSDAEQAIEPQAESGTSLSKPPDTEEFIGARDVTTRRLEREANERHRAL